MRNHRTTAQTLQPGPRPTGPIAAAPTQFAWNVRILPIVLMEIYLNFTLLWVAIGPCAWDIQNPLALYGFAITAHLALLGGYLVGIRRTPTEYRGPIRAETLTLVCILVALVWAIPNFYLTRTDIRSIADVPAMVAAGASDLSGAYADKFSQISIHSSVNPVVRLSMVFLPFMGIKFFLGVFYWNRINWFWRGAFLLSMLCDVATWFMIGTTKGIADICIALPLLVLARNQHRINRLSLRRLVFFACLGGACFAVLFLFFTAAKVGPDETQRADLVYDPSSPEFGRPAYALISQLPTRLQYSTLRLSSYVTQGYYGLSLCLDEPFKWTYGFGHGFFTADLSRRIFGPGYILERSYPGRAQEQGWDVLINWHTAYPWIASDFTFPGAVVVVFLIGWLFAATWLDVLRGTNPFAVGLFGLLTIMLAYLPANNQVLAFYRTAIAFWVVLAAWLVTRRRYFVRQSWTTTGR